MPRYCAVHVTLASRRASFLTICSNINSLDPSQHSSLLSMRQCQSDGPWRVLNEVLSNLNACDTSQHRIFKLSISPRKANSHTIIMCIDIVCMYAYSVCKHTYVATVSQVKLVMKFC